MENFFKDIKDYEGLYQASQDGTINSLDRMVNFKGSLKFVKGKKLLPFMDSKGYLKVGLSKEGKSVTYNIHRLIAETFLENPENKCSVDHKDGNKTNNKVSNLRWATFSENQHNSGVQKNNKLGLKGVRYCPAVPKLGIKPYYRAYISINSKVYTKNFSIHLHESAEKAKEKAKDWRNQLAKEFMPDFFVESK